MGTLTTVLVPANASAEPVSKLSSIEEQGDGTVVAHVYSASMDRVVSLEVRTAADTSEPRPTLYLLNGSSGGEGIATWHSETDVEEFFDDKNVNVVTPLEGAFSYYTDWVQDDPVLGRNKWTTFLTQELPPIIDETFGTSGVNAIAGLSMGGTSVLSLAIAQPQLYRAVGAYSGCAETSTALGRFYVRTVVEAKGGADVENMWGSVGAPAWSANDAYVHAERLRGIALYISSATGLPGKYDHLGSPTVNNDPVALANQVVVGGVIEAAVHQCTLRLEKRLAELEIPAHIESRPTGTHSWGYWQDDLHNSWPMIAEAIGL
ncbi:alpha/beta hydrolase family protein [Rhodococcus sp. CC-R104]|uniref:Alpha/beta hydrolase family protein n=1 Tax=Rhodococcus chondri TaxID=3065941 RepID=A0ABU7JXJ5_9NOCA|nr:alpha/beta hydrolase family protein [Rhodococcus sp. CC-R104]MEE2034741.1 alpha/beta hydrolase family protein [Rhodococcus sp. CC-R104]